METAGQVVDYVVRGGLAVFLILVIVGGSRGWWSFKRDVDAIREERNHWRAQAEELMFILVQQEITDAEHPKEGRR